MPANHPLRVIREVVNEVLVALDAEFSAMYSGLGRASIAPERLLRGSLIQAFYTIRPEDGPGSGSQAPSEPAEKAETQASAEADDKAQPANTETPMPTADANRSRNEEVDFHGQKRTNATHASTTAPEARLFRKGKGKEAKLSYMGHATTENRHGLVVETEMTQATGTAEREAAKAMIESHAPGSERRSTVGADNEVGRVVGLADMRQVCVTPHVAQNNKGRASAIDARTTRHQGYAVSQKRRKLIEEAFGWAKTIGGLARPMRKGKARMGFVFTFTMAAYDLVRLPRLLAEAAA